MINKWDRVYEHATTSYPYGDSTTYLLGAAFLKGLAVEDWGPYTGIDGSCSQFATMYEYLCTCISKTDGLFMRHILEHNHEWKKILQNAVEAFQKRMVLVIFTPFGETTRVLQETDYGAGRIPDISFARKDLLDVIGPYVVKEETLKTATQYFWETVFYLEKP